MRLFAQYNQLQLMKFKPKYLLLPFFLIIGYFTLKFGVPVYANKYVFLVLIILADFYLWSSVKKQVFNYRYWLRILIIVLYWFPMFLLTVLLFSSVIIPIINWNDVLRTYMVGIVLVFYTAKILPITFLLLADIVRAVKRLFVIGKKESRKELLAAKNDEGITRSKFLQYIGFVSGGLVLSTMFIGMFKWAYEFKIIRNKISFLNLPIEFDGFKIVQISDIHLGSWSSKKPLQQAVDMINNQQPDLILFTGDIVNYSTKETVGFENILSQLKATYGVYAVLGNHDYGNYVSWPTKKAKQENMQQLLTFFDDVGWKLLNNENIIINKNSKKLALIGVENWGANPRFPKYGDIDKAMLGADGADIKVLMTHDPSHWEKVIIPNNYDIDLSLSGHTHGFQFGLETKDIKWSPAQYMYKHWAGLYESEKQTGKYIYVNRGLGSIGYPGRIGMLPEITVIELVT